ncbi:MAG: DUF1579 domain-containing protein [candidate division Zixibacteria bacterium]|nr:DUF1579 domain-containing protein [candidate division Zixibacteria bacterium]
MKTKLFVLIAIAAITLSGIYIVACSEEPPMSDEEVMKIYMKYATPGEQHKQLQADVGSWEFSTKWWEEEGAKPEESKGTSEVKAIFGGKFIYEDVSGEMMGNPFKGIAITGYDNFKEQYVSFWIDEMSTSMMISYGTPDESGKLVTYEGTYDDLITGEKDKKSKSIMRIIDNDNRIYEMFEWDEDGKEYKSFEIVYTRKK